MAEIINFNKARKAKAQADKTVRAQENRARFGRSKAEKQAEAAETSARAAREQALKDAGGPERLEEAAGADWAAWETLARASAAKAALSSR